MIATPEEAKAKWCPHGHAGNLNHAPPEHPIDWRMQRCLADGCMAWSWVDDKPDPNHPRLGYCGLVKPR